MRDCSHPHIPAQFLLIRTRWTNAEEGKQGLREARETLSAPTGEPHPAFWWQIPSESSVSTTKASPAPTLEGSEGPALTQSSATPGESWHSAGLQGKLAFSWHAGKVGILLGYRESWYPAGIQEDQWQPGGTAEETPEQGEPCTLCYIF